MRDFEEEDKGEGLLMGVGFVFGVMEKLWNESGDGGTPVCECSK